MRRLRDPVFWIAALILIGSGTLGTIEAIGWVGRPFPGFLVLQNRVVASAGLPTWPGVEGGAIYQHEIAAVDGEPLLDVRALHDRVSRVPIGTPIRYELRDRDRRLERTIATRLFGWSDFLWLFGGYLACGVTFGGTALGIRYLRGRDRLASGTFPVLSLVGLFALTAMDLYGPYRLFRLHALCESLLFAGVLHMALVFPQPVRILERRMGLVHGAYGTAALLALITQLTLFVPSVYVKTHLLASSALGAATLVLVGSQVGRFLRPRSFEARQRIKVLALGTAAVLTPAALLALAAAFSGGRESWSWIALTSAAFPLFIGYATLRHDLLQVDAFVRRSLSYAILTVLLSLVYLGAIRAFEGLFHRSTPGSSESFGFLFSVFCVVLLLPLRDRLQAGIDRLFFRTAYDFRRIIETTSSRLASVAELGAIAAVLRGAVEEALHPEALTLCVRRRPEADFDRIDGPGLAGLGLPDVFVRAESSFEPLDTPAGGLLVPFRSDGRLIGLLLLGRPLSGRLYGGDDRRLLRTLANHGAVAIENALALEQLQELNRNLETKVEERTRELRDAQAQLVHQEKMASIGQFVAGIAHELNNPLNFIQGNLHFLREYVATMTGLIESYEDTGRRQGGPIDAELRRLREEAGLDAILADLDSVFDGCGEGISRSTSLVKDLRTFSRVDSPERMSIDLHEALDSTLNLLRGKLLGIDLLKDYGSLPPVECVAGQINQVFMNLISNAADALETGGTITLRSGSDGKGHVWVEVADDGCGIEPEHLDRIFDPFFTTKPVGKGTGLGLAISYGIVARHQGTIQVRSEVGRGTCFRVELPVRLKRNPQSGR